MSAGGSSGNLGSTHPYLHSRIQIGNSKGPIQYELKQTVFHHDDVPKHKRTRKEEVKEYARRKILDGPSQWNISNKPNKPIMERRTMENHVKDRSHQYQFNHRAESLDPLRNVEPLDKSTKFHISVQLESTAKEIMNMKRDNPIHRGQFHRTQEMPNHPKLENSIPWNNGMVLTEKEVKLGLEKKTQHALEWTGKVNQTLPHRKEYISPMMATKLLGEKVRQKKFEGTFSWKELINKPPTPPEEVFEIKNRELNEGMRKKHIHIHSGTWGPNNIDGRYYKVHIFIVNFEYGLILFYALFVIDRCGRTLHHTYIILKEMSLKV